MWDSITSGHSRFTETCRDSPTKCERTDSQLSICIWITQDGCCVIPECEQAPSVCTSKPQKFRAINSFVIITVALYLSIIWWFVTFCVVKWGMTATFLYGSSLWCTFWKKLQSLGTSAGWYWCLTEGKKLRCYGTRYEAFHCGAEEETAGQYRSRS